MRKVTREVVAGFFAGIPGCWGNTQVADEDVIEDNGFINRYVVMRLHANVIARRPRYTQRPVEITNAGWDTRTTRDRLYGICDYLEVNRQVVVDLPDNTWITIAR